MKRHITSMVSAVLGILLLSGCPNGPVTPTPTPSPSTTPSPSPSAAPIESPGPSNEGSAAQPIELAADVNHIFRVGLASAGEGFSYYSFIPPSTGAYYLSPGTVPTLTATMRVYSDAGFSSLVSTIALATEEIPFGTLTSGETVYISLENPLTTRRYSQSWRIMSPAFVASHGYSDGTVSSPLALALDAPHSCQIGGHSWSDVDYYSFTTGSTWTSITLSIEDANAPVGAMYYFLGTDPTFDTFVQEGSISSGGAAVWGLAAGTTYYLRMARSAANLFDVRGTFTLSVLTPPFTYEALPLRADPQAAYTAGAISSGMTEKWYRVDLPDANGGSYVIGWDDQYQGSHTYSLDIAVSAYRGNGSTVYFTRADSAYTTPQAITVPAGESMVLLRVMPWSAGGTGTFGIKFTRPATGGVIIIVH
jgi:hypothetical protein